MFFLHCADFFPNLEERLLHLLRKELSTGKNLTLEQCLIVVPTTAIRKRLLSLLATHLPDSLRSVNILSINHLAIKIVLESSRKAYRIVSDPLFFPFALYQLSRTKNIDRFKNFRTCLALYQTLRDLTDGGVTSELFQQLIEESRHDPDLDFLMKSSDASSLVHIYSEFEKFLKEYRLLNLQMTSAGAAQLAEDWISSKRFFSVVVYGFYDSTETQLELLEKLLRATHRKDQSAHFLFPFRVDWNNQVQHPGEFAQPFFDRLRFLTEALNGNLDIDEQLHRLASGGVETLLFVSPSPSETEIEEVRRTNCIEVFNAGGYYDEVWGIAKRILHLVKTENVSFDQVVVITRHLEDHLIAISHIFEENRIPCTVSRDNTLSFLPYARFAYSIVLARLARLDKSTLFELLSSPFISQPTFGDFHNLDAILSGLLIRNWDDWERITPLLESDELPLTFEFVKQDELDSFRKTVRYLHELRRRLQEIPETATLPEFAMSLQTTLQSLSRFPENEDTNALHDLLNQIASYSMLEEAEIGLSEFADLLKSYFQRSVYEQEEDERTAKVIVGDIMQLRGITADYVFVAGLNKDVFPRRVQEDPFLPDRTRERLRKISGAGPAPKRSDQRLLPSKEGSAEELLLFSLALRAAKKKLVLSYLRADNSGRKKAPSGYLDEVLKTLTGKNCEANEAIVCVPKHQKTKFLESGGLRPEVLPNQTECATLTDYFSISSLASHLYHLSPAYVEHFQNFAERMNSLQPESAREMDGCINQPAEFWSAVLQGNDKFRISYSRFKNYLECPFKFFAATILGLLESPKDSEEEDHDVSQLMKGLISEDLVKRALRLIRDEKYRKDQAILEATAQVRTKYRSIFPPILLDAYLKLFQTGATNLIDYLEQSGFNLRKTEIPDREQGGEVGLVQSAEKSPSLVIKGIPDFIFHKNNGDGLVVDLKWRTKGVINTPAGIFAKNEAQFCIYPAVVHAKNGSYFPFSYFRLDAFGAYGSPAKIEQKLYEISRPREPQVLIRIFGGEATIADCQKFFTVDVHQKGVELLNGDFRIIDDPNSGYSVCRYCDFTQVCRRTHTATLLRSKQV